MCVVFYFYIYVAPVRKNGIADHGRVILITCMNVCLHYSVQSMTKVYIASRVESGLDEPDYLGHLGHFLLGQVGLICKLNYLDVTQIYNRSHVISK